jgi:hypothetical protein
MPDSNGDTIEQLRNSTFGRNSFEDVEQESQVKNALQAPNQPAYSKLAQQHRILNSVEEDALQNLYDATNGDSWTNNFGWKTDSDLNFWYGVTATSSTVVTIVALQGNGLIGTIPPSIGNLAALQQLNLGFADGNFNSLTGTIPTQFGSLVLLTYLGLHGNSLSGSVPSEIATMTSLRWIELYTNSLEGSLPDSISLLTAMEFLYLYTNSLSGTLPASLSSCTRLQILEVQNNFLSGETALRTGISRECLHQRCSI